MNTSGIRRMGINNNGLFVTSYLFHEIYFPDFNHDSNITYSKRYEIKNKNLEFMQLQPEECPLPTSTWLVPRLGYAYCAFASEGSNIRDETR
jgi:hypothetical protein